MSRFEPMRCDSCRKDGVSLDLHFRNDEAVYLCRRCRDKAPCPICRRWVKRRVLQDRRSRFRWLCERCHREIDAAVARRLLDDEQ